MMPFITLFAASLLLKSTYILAADPPAINTNHASFADALTAELYTNENECSSSWGVSMAFGLVYPSATGDSADQIRTVLGYPSGSQLQLVWNDTANRLDEANDGHCQFSYSVGGVCDSETPTLEIANSIWIDDQTGLNQTYRDVVGNAVRQIDFADFGAAGVINEWVKNSTHGLIDSIVMEGPLLPAILIAVNSIYLKASWAEAFEEGRTNEDFFYTGASRETALPTKTLFMHSVNTFPYSHNALPGFQIVQLPFNGDSLSMIFVLPVSESSGTAMSSDVLGTLSLLEYTRIALALPKFKFESEYEQILKSSLEALGLTAPFQGGLCVLEGSCLGIDSVIQKTIIDVNEKGVEAAAVTALGFRSEPPDDVPILFMADHPVQFFIYDRNEDLVLFEGRFGAPSTPSSSAQLQAMHSDADFWSSNFGVANPIVISETQMPSAPTSSSSVPQQTALPSPQTIPPEPQQTASPTPQKASPAPQQTASPAPQQTASPATETASPAPETASPAPQETASSAPETASLAPQETLSPTHHPSSLRQESSSAPLSQGASFWATMIGCVHAIIGGGI